MIIEQISLKNNKKVINKFSNNIYIYINLKQICNIYVFH